MKRIDESLRPPKGFTATILPPDVQGRQAVRQSERRMQQYLDDRRNRVAYIQRGIILNLCIGLPTGMFPFILPALLQPFTKFQAGHTDWFAIMSCTVAAVICFPIFIFRVKRMRELTRMID